MKHNTKTLAISAAAVVLMIGIVVACSKEAANQTTNMNRTAMKSVSTRDNLVQSVYEYWQLCDRAYRTDSSGFFQVCRTEDYEMFCQVVGIPAELPERINRLAHIESAQLEGENGAEWQETSVCIPCISGGLVTLGTNVMNLRTSIDRKKELGYDDTIPMFEVLIDSCLHHCRQQSFPTNTDFDLCMMKCLTSLDDDTPSAPIPIEP